jgi:DNA-binding transcriptional regulator YdaS (Cro superfamily)
MNPQFRKFVHDMGGQAKVATLLGMSSGHVSLLYNGKRKVTPKMAARIEIASGGAVTKESLVFGVRRG